jgi:hypothetical protein
MHGVGPLLAVRGESILSWIGDDNFVVEDETTSSHEVIDLFIIYWDNYKNPPIV